MARPRVKLAFDAHAAPAASLAVYDLPMNLTYAEAARHHRLAHAVFGFRDELIVSEPIIARKRAKTFRRFTGAGLAFQTKPPAIGAVLFLRLAVLQDAMPRLRCELLRPNRRVSKA